MRGSNGTNPAAGKRWLFPKSHSRLIDDQTESVALVVRADERLIKLARAFAEGVAEIHGDLRSSERHMVSANERATSAAYEPPAVASMSRPRNERRTAERRALVFA